MTGTETPATAFGRRRSTAAWLWRTSAVEPGRKDPRRHGALVAPALAALLPRVGEDPDAPAEHEQAPGQGRGETEFGVDHRRGAVDVHRDRAGPAPVERLH